MLPNFSWLILHDRHISHSTSIRGSLESTHIDSIFMHEFFCIKSRTKDNKCFVHFGVYAGWCNTIDVFISTAYLLIQQYTFCLHWMRWVRSLLLLSFPNVFIGFISLKILLNVFCNIKRSLNRGKYSHNHKIIIALMLLWYVSCHSSPMTCKKSYHYFVCNFSMLWTCGLNIQKDKTLRLLLLWLELLECA